MSGTQQTDSGGGAGERDWLPEAHRGDAAFAKYQSMDDLLAGFKSAQSFIGADKATVLRIPTDEKDEAGWGAVHKQLGRPDDPTGYGVKTDGPDGALWQKALPEMHKLGFTAKQVQGVQAMLGAMGAEYATQFDTPDKALAYFLPKLGDAVASEAFADATVAQLKQVWGQAFDDKMHAANRLAAMFAETQNPEITKLFKAPQDGGYGLANLPGFVAMMAELGEKLTENGSLTGGAGQNQGRALTPDQAQADISTMMADPDFRAAYNAGKPDAVDRWNRANNALVARA